MTDQFDPGTDLALDSLDHALGNQLTCTQCKHPLGYIALIDFAKKQFDETWTSIFGFFDKAQSKPGLSARFIGSRGATLSREVTNPEERLDTEALRGMLTEEQWELVTVPSVVRVFSQDALTRVVKAGLVPARLVRSATVKPKPVASRHRRKTTREDAAFLRRLQSGEREEEAAG